NCAWLCFTMLIYVLMVFCAVSADHFVSCAILPWISAALIGPPIGVVHSTVFNKPPATNIKTKDAIALRLQMAEKLACANQDAIIAATSAVITDTQYTPIIGI